MKQIVSSREYKVMLKAERFTGSESDLLGSAEDFWSAFKSAIADSVLDTDGSLDEIEKRRTVRFYDTQDHHRLRKNDYVFRERCDCDTNERQVTLKFRHPDRYIAQDRNMAAADEDIGKTKFEEDIKHPFLKLFSFSTKQPIPKDKNLNRMDDPFGLFPGLKDRLIPAVDEDEPIDVVGGFTARELVVTGADFQIGEDPKVEAECGLIAWYDDGGDHAVPLLVEFSFKYKDKKEAYDGKVAQRAYDVFQSLVKRLPEWTKPKGQTKTAYVYSRANPAVSGTEPARRRHQAIGA